MNVMSEPYGYDIILILIDWLIDYLLLSFMWNLLVEDGQYIKEIDGHVLRKY
jgi:hypothetical protein